MSWKNVYHHYCHGLYKHKLTVDVWRKYWCRYQRVKYYESHVLVLHVHTQGIWYLTFQKCTFAIMFNHLMVVFWYSFALMMIK